jgi:hypothetical protein
MGETMQTEIPGVAMPDNLTKNSIFSNSIIRVVPGGAV